MKVEKQLAKLGLDPKEGQNFLNSEVIVKALVESGEIDNDERILEIGPGTGIITKELLKRTNNLVAVESDRRLASHLEKRFSNEEIKILNQDILEYDISTFDKCISNIPFNLSSEILKKLGENQVQSSLIIQEALADKIVADPGESNYKEFTVIINYYFIPVKLRKVSKNCFTPSPEVNAAIVKLYPNKNRHGVEDEELFFKITKALFTHKRKKVRNSIVDARNILQVDKEDIKSLRDQIPFSEKRVNELEIIELKKITEFLQSKLF